VYGLIEGLPSDLEVDALLNLVVMEAIETSEIEGESLLRSDVMSSVKNNLGLNAVSELVSDHRAEGIAELMIVARHDFDQVLTEAMLFEWHRLLFKGINFTCAQMSLKPELAKHAHSLGNWRQGTTPMQVVSGRIGNPTIHFEAPPSAEVPELMRGFIQWFNDSRDTLPGAVRAAVAHLYFESIHPFEDSNGRMGRASAEKALSRSLGSPVLMSLSRTINANKKGYYNALETAQRSSEITP
jgi:Fic family protein